MVHDIFFDDRITKYMLFNTTAYSLEILTDSFSIISTHPNNHFTHYSDVIMGAMESQITSLPIVYLTVYSSEDQRKHQSSASLAFVWGIHRWPVNSPHKWPVTRKMFPFDDVVMKTELAWQKYHNRDKCLLRNEDDFFRETYEILISMMSVLLIWSKLFLLLFPYGSADFIWYVAH